jgi:hypothetical protein
MDETEMILRFLEYGLLPDQTEEVVDMATDHVAHLRSLVEADGPVLAPLE